MRAKAVFLTMLLILSFPLSVIAEDVVYRQMPERIGVSPDHVWTIEFARQVDADTLDQGIHVDGIDYTIHTGDDLRKVHVSADWELGESYVLRVDDVLDKRGEGLMYNVEMPFTVLDEGQYRIELNWGELPYDLDLQMYYRNNRTNEYQFLHSNNREIEGVARLDRDVVSGFGTETIVIEDIESFSNRWSWYTFVVLQNTYEVSLGESGATVSVYNTDGLYMESEVRPDMENDLWAVFQIRDRKWSEVRSLR